MTSHSLRWQFAGPWTYRLGEFGTIGSVFGLREWVARVGDLAVGTYASLCTARRTLEQAARDAGYAVIEDI